ncbi:quinolinate synthase NadA [Ruficoccus sp. ZRK36]|uniref:quinolinate synthase NadA n=1 Tax=Ruficoccus sp. ZRK36 TaxID=2866311 RepID=UPI001C72FAD1|nr:quinolinate synthase NadA [Ruficoccus sp. ZRK36]QYY34721.1 quinolinate synthase NadA [Ruficoccus sp. ZRK36]
MSETLDFEPLTLPSLNGPEEPLSAIQEEILALKKERNAVILVHNYQIDAIQRVGDYVGDSLGLAYNAAETDADVIVFCGVHFMAETAKIVNPSKTVLLPELEAGCSLSDSCPADKLAAYRAANPDLYVVAYINCSAAVKALSDVICTSGNAVKIVEQIPEDKEILFVPDQNLGQWVARQTGRKMRLWPGSCYAHVLFTARALEKVKAQYPGAPVVAHPECVEAVRDMADEVCSTEKMIGFCKTHPSREIIVATETGMLNRLRREIPGKIFIAGPTETCACNDCRYMKMNTVEKLRNCLRDLSPEITMEESVRSKAYDPIKRMLDWSKA